MEGTAVGVGRRAADTVERSRRARPQRYADDLSESLLHRLPHEVWGTNVARPESATRLEEEIAADGVHWKFIRARVSIWDGGAGLLVLTYVLDVSEECSWSSLEGIVDEAAGAVLGSPVWTSAVAAAGADAPTVLTSGGDMVGRVGQLNMKLSSFSWCHRTVVVALDEWDETAAQAIADAFVHDGTDCELGADAPYSVVRFSLAACYVGRSEDVTIDRSGSDDGEPGVLALERLVSVHTAIWRTLHTCELDLLEMAVEWRSRRLEIASAQMKRMEELLALYEAMQGVTASLHDVEVHLSSRDRKLWQALSAQWDLERRLNGIDERLRTVRDLYATAAAHAGARRADKFTSFAWVFTLLGAVSTCLAVVGFLSPDQSTVWRAVSVGATVCAVLFVWLAFMTWQRGSWVGGQQRTLGGR